MPCSPIPKASAPKSILVVDDEPMLASTLRLLLMVNKYNVHVAANGPQALADYQPGKYDLVVTDLFMPGMDGLELATGIRKLSPAQPIVLFTNLMSGIEPQHPGLPHIDYLLEKPASLKQVRLMLTRMFGDT